jgi:hypothetical protein
VRLFTGENVTKKVINNPEINNFENGLEYCSAVEKSCNVIITENKKDFYSSQIE